MQLAAEIGKKTNSLESADQVKEYLEELDVFKSARPDGKQPMVLKELTEVGPYDGLSS